VVLLCIAACCRIVTRCLVRLFADWTARERRKFSRNDGFGPNFAGPSGDDRTASRRTSARCGTAWDPDELEPDSPSIRHWI
jgi:hypothetical protein